MLGVGERREDPREKGNENKLKEAEARRAREKK